MIEIGMALRLKGIAEPRTIAEAAGVAIDDAAGALAQMVAGGHASETPRGHRITPEGKLWLDGLLADERAALDGAAVERTYERFCEHNATFKQLVTDWQMREVDGEPRLNDHTDPVYDSGIVERLDQLHGSIEPVLAEAVALCPRLGRYPERLRAALAMIHDGDHSWLAAPMKDSYHTVWFELHEELILLCGRNRADEAAQGRGA